MTITDEISTKPVPVPGFDYTVSRVAYAGRGTTAIGEVGPPPPRPKKEWRTAQTNSGDPRCIFIAYGRLPEYDDIEDLKCLAAKQKTIVLKADDFTWPTFKCGEAPFAKTVKEILDEFTVKTWKALARDELTRPLLLRSHECGEQSDLKEGRWITSHFDEVAELAVFTTAYHYGTTRCAVNPGVRADWLAKIEALGLLERGWNGYKAPAPSMIAVKNGKNLFEVACDHDIMPERVNASAMGGVGMTFTVGTREVIAELYNNGTAHALFADNATEEMDTRPISPTAEGYNAFLDEVRRYLYGQASAR